MHDPAALGVAASVIQPGMRDGYEGRLLVLQHLSICHYCLPGSPSLAALYIPGILGALLHFS